MNDYETWSLWISGFTAFAGLTAGGFVGLQVRQAAKNTRHATEERQKEWDLRRRESSMQFYMATLENRDARKTRLPPDRDAAGIARIIEESKGDTAKLDTIRSHLSYYEMLATGVNSGVLDEDIVNRFGGGPVIAAWQNYRGWVEERRVEFNAPTMFTELETLASRLAARPDRRANGG